MSFSKRLEEAKQLLDSHLDFWLFSSEIPVAVLGEITPVPSNGFIQIRAIYNPTDFIIDTRELPEEDVEGKQTQYEHNQQILDEILPFVQEISEGHVYTAEEVSMGLNEVMKRDYEFVYENKEECIDYEHRPTQPAITPNFPNASIQIKEFLSKERMTVEELRATWFESNIRYLAQLIRNVY
jgi:hypothetical protein